MTEVVVATLLLTALVLALSLCVLLARAVLVPARPARVTVNALREVPGRTGDRLLGTLGDAGILLPSACAGAGTCGLCRVRVTEGGGAALPVETALLSRAELRDGTRLACQTVLRGDIGVEVPVALLEAESFDCTVLATRFLTPLIREVTLGLPPGRRPAVEAGCFVQVTAPAYALRFADIAVPERFAAAWAHLRRLRASSDAPVSRAYSVSNLPEDTEAGRLVLDIRIALPPPSPPDAPPGIVSSWLFSVTTGQRVAVSGPFGAFRAKDDDREMVLVGGGVGMAPLRAIVHDQLSRPGTRRIRFCYGARSEAELIYRDEFDALAAEHHRFDWIPVLSDLAPGEPWAGATGFVHDTLRDGILRDHPAPEESDYYLCGPPLMIRAVLAVLDDAGVDQERIFNDDFGS